MNPLERVCKNCSFGEIVTDRERLSIRNGYPVDPDSWGDELKVHCSLIRRDVEQSHTCKRFMHII